MFILTTLMGDKVTFSLDEIDTIMTMQNEPSSIVRLANGSDIFVQEDLSVLEEA